LKYIKGYGKRLISFIVTGIYHTSILQNSIVVLIAVGQKASNCPRFHQLIIIILPNHTTACDSIK